MVRRSRRTWGQVGILNTAECAPQGFFSSFLAFGGNVMVTIAVMAFIWTPSQMGTPSPVDGWSRWTPPCAKSSSQWILLHPPPRVLNGTKKIPLKAPRSALYLWKQLCMNRHCFGRMGSIQQFNAKWWSLVFYELGNYEWMLISLQAVAVLSFKLFPFMILFLFISEKAYFHSSSTVVWCFHLKVQSSFLFSISHFSIVMGTGTTSPSESI